MIQGFERVGPQIPFGESQVSVDDAMPIRDFVACDLLALAGKSWHDLSDEHDVTAYAMYFKPFDENEMEAVDRYVSVRLAHALSPDDWRLAIGLRSFQAADRLSNKWIRYCFQSTGGELMVAKKEVYLIMGRLMMEPSAGGIEQTFVEERKMYERPLNGDDCEDILETVRSTYNRRLVTRRR